MSEVKKHLIAVYGTLREGCSNHKLIKDTKYIGSYESKPIFNMYSAGDQYPMLKLGGTTSVLFEVYEVTDERLKAVDTLEDYSPDRKTYNLYDRKSIYTPYGEAYFYVYNMSVKGNKKIESGDWKEYIESKPINRITARA